MEASDRQLSMQLTARNLRPSKYRLRILGFLNKNRCHPTIRQIYDQLKPLYPGISKTTVYNTINAFLSAGLVSELIIEADEARYDAILDPHGHIKCILCGAIANFTLDPKLLESQDLAGFRIMDRNIHYIGICPQCLLDK